MDSLTKGMPVNYHARYAGEVGRLLAVLDEIDEQHPRVRRPLSYALRQSPAVVERMLALLLVHAYRRGMLP